MSPSPRTVLDLPWAVKRLLVVLLDVGMSVIATWLAFSLRLDTPHWPTGMQWLPYALAPVLSVPVFIRMGLYRAIFRYTGLTALVTIAKACMVYGALLLGTLLTLQWRGIEGLPRSLGILQPLIFLLGIGASRAIARAWLATLAQQGRPPSARLLIYGAGNAGAQTAAAIANTRQFELVGFLDDDSGKVGRSINGINVHSAVNAERVVQATNASDILLALPSVTRQRRNEIIARLAPLPVHVRTLPGLADLASGRISLNDIRELDIEDLLGRDAIAPLPDLMDRTIAGRDVLVTGAGGSIGSELCRQILALRPRRLVLLDHHEFGLYAIHQELQAVLKEASQLSDLVPVLANVASRQRMGAVLREHRPHTIFHAAAYKHVPLVESNASEGLANNVFGTLAVAQAARDCGVSRFILISTDKAVRPTNVMGASKRVAEMILQALAADEEAKPSHERVGIVYTMVRFGNVLGSSGSVVPLFRQQIARGGPVTVTHPEVTRYFMTIPEAVQLVIQAGAMARGGEVFVLDMGEPVRIIDLARRMIDLAGLSTRSPTNPSGDIEIQFTGLRPGEKLYEELLIGDNPLSTAHPRIMRAREEFLGWSSLGEMLAQLESAVRNDDSDAIVQQLTRLVPGSSIHTKANALTPLQETSL